MTSALLPHDLPPTPDYPDPSEGVRVPTGELAEPTFHLREVGHALGRVLVGPDLVLSYSDFLSDADDVVLPAGLWDDVERDVQLPTASMP